MLLTWMAYATLIGVMIAAVASALDMLAVRRGVATRFIWLGALAVAAVAPALASWNANGYSPKAHVITAGEVAAGTAAAASKGAPSPAVPRTARLRVRVIVFLLKIDPYLGRLWLAASIAYAVILFRAALAIHRRRRRWQVIEMDGDRVRVSPDTGPAVVGMIRPEIVLPQWALAMDESSRALMLRHEFEHIRARDPLVLTAGVLLSAIFPWNAAVWLIVRRLRLAIEIDCDRRVVGTTADAREYGELLLTVGSRRGAPFIFVASLVERPRFLEQRIKAMTPSALRYPRLTAAALILGAIVVCTAAIRAPRPVPFTRRAVLNSDSLTIQELRVLLASHQPDALIAASRVNTVTVILDANGNYVTSLAETRAVTDGGGRGGRGGPQRYITAGELSMRDQGGMTLSGGRAEGAPGGRARGNVRDDVPSEALPPPPARITKQTEMQRRDPVSGDTVRSFHIASLARIDGDTVILSLRESSGEVGYIKHVYITLDGPIGAGELFGFDENVLGSLVSVQQVHSVHAHAYASGELAEQRLNVFVVRLK